MAGNIKGITIEFKGDTTQLGKALSNVNKDIRATDSALREVDKALKLDPSNVELLAQKEALLAKQVEQTKDKLDLQAQAAEAAAQALAEGTISQEEYAKLAAQVSTTASKLDELEASASESSGSLESAADAAGEVGDQIGDAGDSAKSSGDSFVDWSAVVSGACDAALAAVQAIAEAIQEATTALVNMTTETADYADNILTLSSTSGVAADTLQALTYGEEILDVSVGTVTSSITKLIKSMSSAADGATAWQEQQEILYDALAAGDITMDEYREALEEGGTAFDQLGIDILDSAGNLRDSEEVFWDIIDALGEIDNETERDAAAMSILGRSARELNPLIEAGSQAFRDIYNEAEAAGAIMDDDMLNRYDEFNDTLARLEQGTAAAKRALGSILLPVLEQMGTSGVALINDFTNAVLDTNGDVEQLGAVIDEMIPAVVEYINTYLPTIIELGGAIIQVLAEALLSNLPLILSTGLDIIMTIAQGLIDNLTTLAPTVAEMIVQLVRFLVDNLPTVIDAAVQIIIAVTEGMAEAMPELIPAVVDAILTICEALIDNLPEIIGASQELFLGIIEGLLLALPDILIGLGDLRDDILNSLMELAIELPDRAMEWGIDMVQALIDGALSMAGNLAQAASNLASSVADYLHFSVPDKGPLADFDQSGGDMVDEFIKSMQGETGALENALYSTSNLIYGGMTSPDYSSALSGISTQLAGLGGSVPQVINVYVGNQKFATAVVDANATNNYRTGGI